MKQGKKASQPKKVSPAVKKEILSVKKDILTVKQKLKKKY